jgi:hypothetical protein
MEAAPPAPAAGEPWWGGAAAAALAAAAAAPLLPAWSWSVREIRDDEVRRASRLGAPSAGDHTPHMLSFVRGAFAARREEVLSAHFLLFLLRARGAVCAVGQSSRSMRRGSGRTVVLGIEESN